MCNYTTQSQTNFSYHIVRRYRNDSNFHVTSTFPGCFYSPKSWCGFKTHFSRKHQQRIDVATVNEHDQMHVDEIPPNCSSQQNMDMHCANFALNLMTKLKIPASCVDTIIEETINLIKISDKVKNMDDNISMLKALNNFCMPKLRTSFLTKQCGYIAPEEIILGQSYRHINGKLLCVNDKGYIIPMLKLLANFLNMPEVWSKVINGHDTDDELMKDFVMANILKLINLYNNICHAYSF